MGRSTSVLDAGGKLVLTLTGPFYLVAQFAMMRTRRREAWTDMIEGAHVTADSRGGRDKGSNLAVGRIAALCLAVMVGGLLATLPGLLRLLAPSEQAPVRQQPRSGPAITAQMYSVDLSELRRVSADDLASSFVPLARDTATDAFLAAAAQEGQGEARLAALGAQHMAYKRAQRRGMSRTDASAKYLNVSMLVATAPQFRALLQRAGASNATSLLDIGAGRGFVTAELAEAMRLNAGPAVTALEASPPLRTQLRERGFRAVESLADLDNATFGAVALLNVLDRCDHPRELLRAAARAVDAQGLLLVATVLPFCDKVYAGRPDTLDAHRPPHAPLALPRGVRCGDWPRLSMEASAAAFAGTVLANEGLEVAAWTRVPYLASGGVQQSHYTLDNAVFVLRRTAARTPRTHARGLAHDAAGAGGAGARGAAGGAADTGAMARRVGSELRGGAGSVLGALTASLTALWHGEGRGAGSGCGRHGDSAAETWLAAQVRGRKRAVCV